MRTGDQPEDIHTACFHLWYLSLVIRSDDTLKWRKHVCGNWIDLSMYRRTSTIEILAKCVVQDFGKIVEI